MAYIETDSAGVTRLKEGAATQLVKVADANYTLLAGETLLEYTSLTATRTVTLPSARAVPGQRVDVKDGSGLADGSHKITVAAPALTPDTDQLRWRRSLASSGENATMRLATAAALPSCTASGAGVGKTLTAAANGALSIDGVSVNAADAVLVKDQANPVDNGIYVVTAAGDGSHPFILTRKTTFDASSETLPGYLVTMSAGSTLSGQYWVLRGGIDDAASVSLTTALDKVTLFSTGVVWRALE